MKNTPGYLLISGSIRLVLDLVLRAEVTVVIEAERRGAGDAVTAVRVADGLEKTSRFFSRRAFSQSVRASSSYILRVIDSAPADSPPCGVAVTHANAGRSPAASTPTSVGMSPARTPRQNAASPSGASSLAMFSGVPAT